jgi:hypothetical protein
LLTKLPPGVAQDADAKLLQRRQDIFAVPAFVGVRGLRVVDAFVDAPPHVLGEAPEEERGNLADRAGGCRS